MTLMLKPRWPIRSLNKVTYRFLSTPGTTAASILVHSDAFVPQ